MSILFIIVASVLGFSAIWIAILYRRLTYFKTHLQRKVDKAARDLDMARKIQTGLLANNFLQYKKYVISAFCEPAEKIGGDFFFIDQKTNYSIGKESSRPGIIKYDGRKEDFVHVIIGDVAGHGVASALVMVLARNTFDEYSKKFDSPAEILTHINKKIMEYTENSDISFVTAFMGLIDPQKEEFIYAKAGHTNPVLLRRDGSIETLDCEGVFLGMFDNQEYEEKKIKLMSGDKLLLYTDGLTETRNAKGDILGTQRFHELLRQSYSFTKMEFLNHVVRQIHAYSAEETFHDDATMVLVEVL